MPLRPKKKFYITTSIAYANASPHIGFALEVIQADVLARYHRNLGEDVFFLSGTDENGEKIYQTALKNRKTPQQFVDEISGKFKLLLKTLNVSVSDFIRTTDENRHWPAAREIWSRARKNGDIYKKKYGGYYCVGCEAFKTEKDLVGGKCPNHQKEPEWREEENYFFRWSGYQKFLTDFFAETADFVVPSFRYNEMKEFLKKGLEDISISRVKEKMPWGIPVPDDDNQVMYVWFDALTNYLSGIGFPENKKEFNRYWPADIHLIGKDIDRWHSLLWTAMLKSAGLSLPKRIFVHGFITSGGQKMSKSIGNVVDPFEVIAKYKSVDALRYYLLREIPSYDDGDFTFEKFEKRYNSDLSGGLGNLLSRVAAMAEKMEQQGFKFKVKIKDPEFDGIIGKTWKDYHKFIGIFRFNDAISAVWDLVGFCDKYIEEKKPWEAKTTEKDKSQNQKIINALLVALTNISLMIRPFLPETSEKIFNQLGIKQEEGFKVKDSNFRVKKGSPLFAKSVV